MGLLDAAVQNRIHGRQMPKYFADSAAGLRQTIDRERILKLGDALMQWPDKSPQGLQKFMQTHNVPFKDMHALVTLTNDFMTKRREIAGPAQPMYETTPEGMRSVEARPWETEGFKEKGLKRGEFKYAPASITSDSERLTIYGPNNQTMRIPVKKGTSYTPPKGWSLKAPPKPESAKSTSGLYISGMNQILKEYGGSGSDFSYDKSTGAFSFSSGGDKAYQDMYEKAEKGDFRAKRNLTTYKNLKKKFMNLTGVDLLETSSSSKPSWKDYQ